MILHNGWLQNLADLKRVGVCTLTYTPKVLTVNMNLGWADLVVSKLII